MIFILNCCRRQEAQTSDLINHSPHGQHAIYSMLRKLRQLGYVGQEITRDRGRVVQTRWVVLTAVNQNKDGDEEQEN